MAHTMELPLASSGSVIELIGGCAILRELGCGGAASVFACRDQDLGRDAAITQSRPRCNKRKHGLTLLKDAGRGQQALHAVAEAQRPTGNNCVSPSDDNGARAAVSSRRTR